MTKTEDQLEKELVSIEGKILSAGEFISATCEGIPDEGVITYDDGLVLTDPVGKADEILKTAHEIKKLALQYQALLNLEAKVSKQNKKATNDAKFGDTAIVND